MKYTYPEDKFQMSEEIKKILKEEYSISYNFFKFPPSEEIKKLFNKYSISFVKDFFDYFEYKYRTNTIMNFNLTNDENKNYGFTFYVQESGKENLFSFELIYFLVFSTPEQVFSDFQRFLDLGPFYDGKITKDI